MRRISLEGRGGGVLGEIGDFFDEVGVMTEAASLVKKESSLGRSGVWLPFTALSFDGIAINNTCASRLDS